MIIEANGKVMVATRDIGDSVWATVWDDIEDKRVVKAAVIDSVKVTFHKNGSASVLYNIETDDFGLDEVDGLNIFDRQDKAEERCDLLAKTHG
jgi:hypothetical protein